MAPSGNGVLPVQRLRQYLQEGCIQSTGPVEDGQLQPASLDLRLGRRAWRVRASFLPGPDATVAERLKAISMHELDLSSGAVLERGCVYVAELQESLQLPDGVSALANAKSTTGRLDAFTRMIADCCAEFDRLPSGYSGPLYAEINPCTFSLLVREGSRLNQIRLSHGQTTLSGKELSDLHSASPVIDPPAHIDEDGLRFSVDLSSTGIAGYRAKPHCGVVDIDTVNHYPAESFWDPVVVEDGELILDPSAFYVLVSREAVRLPPSFAAEMTPYLPCIGEFRVHYAGFFDPGFGYGLDNDCGARNVLEVRCHETPFALRDGQVVGRLVFERMLEPPDVLYGAASGSSYQGQALQLAKQFKRPVCKN